MTNEELRTKIIEILEETEYEWTEEKNGYILQIFYSKLADALIKAGIGDVKTHRVFVSKDGKEVKQLYSGEEVEQIVKERDEYKHRAEVAERALREFAVNCGCDKCPFLGRCYISPDVEGDYQGCFNMYLSISEKELAEEGEDD